MNYEHEQIVLKLIDKMYDYAVSHHCNEPFEYIVKQNPILMVKYMLAASRTPTPKESTESKLDSFNKLEKHEALVLAEIQELVKAKILLPSDELAIKRLNENIKASLAVDVSDEELAEIERITRATLTDFPISWSVSKKADKTTLKDTYLKIKDAIDAAPIID